MKWLWRTATLVVSIAEGRSFRGWRRCCVPLLRLKQDRLMERIEASIARSDLGHGSALGFLFRDRLAVLSDIPNQPVISAVSRR